MLSERRAGVSEVTRPDLQIFGFATMWPRARSDAMTDRGTRRTVAAGVMASEGAGLPRSAALRQRETEHKSGYGRCHLAFSLPSSELQARSPRPAVGNEPAARVLSRHALSSASGGARICRTTYRASRVRRWRSSRGRRRASRGATRDFAARASAGSRARAHIAREPRRGVRALGNDGTLHSSSARSTRHAAPAMVHVTTHVRARGLPGCATTRARRLLHRTRVVRGRGIPRPASPPRVRLSLGRTAPPTQCA